MKPHFISALLVALSLNLVAHPNLDTIKAYYSTINSSELAEQIHYQKLKFFIEWTVKGISTMTPKRYSFEAKALAQTILEQEAEMQKLRENACVIFLEPRFKNTKDFNFSRNIYDFITFETSCTMVTYFNAQNGEMTSLNGRGIFVYSRVLSKENAKKTERFFSFIKKEKPDALLNEGRVFREGTVYANEPGHEFGVLENNTNYLYLKEDKIFVYRTINGEKYELNEFVRKFLDEEEIKRLIQNSKRRVIEY